MISLTGRDAARGQHQIMIPRRGCDRALELIGIIWKDAEIGRAGAEALDQPRQQIAVGVEQGCRRARPARLDDLVAGREHRDPHPPPHRQRRDADCSRQCHMRLGEPPASRQHDDTGAQVLPGQPPVGPKLKASRHDHGAALDAAILLHEDGIGAGRHWRAGEDADRFARGGAHARRHGRRSRAR